MDFDYLQTQSEVTYQHMGIGAWAFKKLSVAGAPDSNTGPENAAFIKHRTEMDGAGWALVSMLLIPGSMTQSSSSTVERSQTSNYNLNWKRLRVA